MTHDELLEEINEAIADFDLKFDNGNPYYKALRAVVKLHKPSIRNNGDTCECDVYDEYMMGYPCDTIQAIEKELG
jgi:hypothetical protein